MQELYNDWLSDSDFFPYAVLNPVAMQELCCDWSDPLGEVDMSRLPCRK